MHVKVQTAWKSVNALLWTLVRCGHDLVLWSDVDLLEARTC